MAGAADGGSAAQLGSTRALAEEGGGENGDGTVGIRMLAARGLLERGTKLAGGMATRAAAEQSSGRAGKRRRGGCRVGPGEEKKENKFEIQNRDVPGFKISPNFYRK